MKPEPRSLKLLLLLPLITFPVLSSSLTLPATSESEGRRSKKSAVFTVHSNHDFDDDEFHDDHFHHGPHNNLSGGGDDSSAEYLEHHSGADYQFHSGSAYLHQDQFGKEGANGSSDGGGDYEEDGVAELTRVLDGFVFLNNLYDVLVRPGQFENSGPTKIQIGLDVQPGFQVNPERNEMTATITLTQNWTDPRLAYESRINHPEKLPYVTLSGLLHQLEPWLPDTYVMNAKRVHKLEVPGGGGGSDLIIVDPTGRVTREQKLTVTVHCPFTENENFPFDTQVCEMQFTSFAWNTSHVEYEGVLNSCWLDSSSSGVFVIEDCHLKSTVFPRMEYKLGSTSGFTKRFELVRNLNHYIWKVYVPLATFTSICIVSMIKPVGPEMSGALSYFMFGLMSIFMGITFRGQDFAWSYGQGRTALDSYFVYCVGTVVLCGLVNLLKLHSSSKPSSQRDESFEMHGQSSSSSTTAHNNNGSTSNSNWTSSSVQDSADLLEDSSATDQLYERVGPSSQSRSRRASYVKAAVKAASTKLKRGLLCCRINEWLVLWMGLLFICWNVVYWAYWGYEWHYARWRFDIF